jgi:hypothetical protein
MHLSCQYGNHSVYPYHFSSAQYTNASGIVPILENKLIHKQNK